MGDVIANVSAFAGQKIVILNSLISPDLGWQLRDAVEINDSGQIVGDGFHNGSEHVFLMTPIPETDSRLLFAFGGLTVLLIRLFNRFSDLAKP